MRVRLFVALGLVSGLAWGQDTTRPASLEPIPDGSPDAAEERSVPAPEVTIRQRGAQGSVEEYRVGGVLYMVKINPDKGTSYYLVDTDGDGNMETRYNDLQSNMAITAWVLLRW